jgi:hypothetical protein
LDLLLEWGGILDFPEYMVAGVGEEDGEAVVRALVVLGELVLRDVAEQLLVCDYMAVELACVVLVVGSAVRWKDGGASARQR